EEAADGDGFAVVGWIAPSVPRNTRAHPTLHRDARVEHRGFLGKRRDEIVIERRVVELDDLRRRFKCRRIERDGNAGRADERGGHRAHPWFWLRHVPSVQGACAESFRFNARAAPSMTPLHLLTVLQAPWRA